MAKVTYKSVIPNDKPVWLQELDAAVDTIAFMPLQGTEQDFRNLHMFLRAEIDKQRAKGLIRNDSKVETEIRTDEGRTVIHLFRNKVLVQTYFIE